eukprot:983839-Rhodomonas_salina.2
MARVRDRLTRCVGVSGRGSRSSRAFSSRRPSPRAAPQRRTRPLWSSPASEATVEAHPRCARFTCRVTPRLSSVCNKNEARHGQRGIGDSVL